MSGLGRWSLGIGIALVIVAVVLASVVNLYGAAAIVGLAGLVGLVMAAYDALYEASKRWAQRRREKKARRADAGR